jgi:glutamate dehydrogenase (NAD(P)+)
MSSLLEDTKDIIEEICASIKIPFDVCTYLTTPNQSTLVSLPLRKKDGRVTVVEGYRVLHSSILGPGKGGLMISDQITMEDCQALAMRMTLKCSLVNLPLGGASGVIMTNPANFTKDEIYHMVRRFTSTIINLIGPKKDIMGPDLNAGPDIMGVIMDTYSMDVGKTVHRVCTGKPRNLGGIIGREEAMGLGLGYLLHELARTEFEEILGQNIVIQGIGNVGKNCARSIDEVGANLMAISDSKGGIYNPDGIDVEKIIKYKETHGNLEGYSPGQAITNAELLTLKCDTLIPCALHNQITKNNVKELHCRKIIEGANGALTKRAIDLLWELNIPVIPDILANSGGVIVSYLEWVQNFQELDWRMEEVTSELKRLLVPVFHRVHQYRVKNNISYRKAAYALAVQHLYKSYQIRGLFP